MSTLTIRKIEPDIKHKLRIAAAAHGHSMAEEVRIILCNALEPRSASAGLGSRIHARFAAIGGADLHVPAPTERACDARIRAAEK